MFRVFYMNNEFSLCIGDNNIIYNVSIANLKKELSKKNVKGAHLDEDKNIVDETIQTEGGKLLNVLLSYIFSIESCSDFSVAFIEENFDFCSGKKLNLIDVQRYLRMSIFYDDTPNSKFSKIFDISIVDDYDKVHSLYIPLEVNDKYEISEYDKERIEEFLLKYLCS